MDSILPIVILWQFRSNSLGQITREQFLVGCQKYKCAVISLYSFTLHFLLSIADIESFKGSLSQMQELLKNPKYVISSPAYH